MNNPLNYDIKLGNVAAPAPVAPRPDPDAPMYASEDGVVCSLSNNECIFELKRTGETHVMTYQVLQALDQCREFRTLDEHVARVLASVPGLQAQREGVVRVLESLSARGLLVSDARFLGDLAAAPARAPAPFRGIFIRACDRPAQLARLFASLTEYERRHRANRHYIVIDDSGDAAAIDRHRDQLREFARATGCKVTHAGAAEQQRLAERIGKALPQVREVLPQLLLRAGSAARFGGGRSWNLALLLAAGQRFALLDDDQCLPLCRPDGARAGLDPNPVPGAYARFYRNMEEALGAGETIEGDPFELHLAACGQALGALVGGDDYRVDRNALRGLGLGRLAHLSGTAPVLATMHGTCGSSRTESGVWLYELDAEGRADLCRDREAYLRNVEAASGWYGFRQARATQVAWFTPFMLDNSRMLPCTNPVGRGEDGLFSVAASLCHADALVLELPVAIGHVQEGVRKRSDVTLAAHTPRFNHFVSAFVQRQLADFMAEDPAQRLALLAANLRDIAGAGAPARIRHLREYLSFTRADLIERLQHQFEAAPDAPVYWQADVRAIIEANGRALLAKSPPRLGDWPADADEAYCAAALRNELERLAAMYEAWPALWAHARDQGERLLSGL